MQLTFLGNTGLRVSELCLGAMTFGTEWGWGADRDEAKAIFDAFVDAGGNFIDTANIYTNGTSERLVGEFTAHHRDRFVIATKYTIKMDETDVNAQGNQRKNLMRSLEASLKRLGTDYIDLYWVHMWDGFTPVEETLRALDDAVRAGKVLHIGFSDFPAWLVARADAVAEVARFTRPAAIQIEYNLAQRDAERELIPMAEHLGLSILDWSPLAGGALTGKLLDRDAAKGRVASRAVNHFDKYLGSRTETITHAVVDAAKDIGCTPAQLAIRWLQMQSACHIPIISARSAEHVRDNLSALNITIPPEMLQRLDHASRIELGFPHDFLATRWPAWFGETPRRFDPRVKPLGRRALQLDGETGQ